MLNSNAIEIKNQYNAGQRDFANLQLRRADLRGLDLSNANFKGADFSYANLRDVNFSGADLREAYFNEADLTGANLQGANLSQASLVKTYLIKSNLQQANLQNAYLSGAYLTKGNLENALLQGAYFNGTQLTGAKFTNAIYDEKTKFDHTVNLEKLGLKTVEQARLEANSKIIENDDLITPEETPIHGVTISAVVKMFNHLLKTSYHYLGGTMTLRYWKSSRPQVDWLNNFEIDNSAKLTYIGDQETPLSDEQLNVIREWIIGFVKSCSMIIQNYTQMLDPQFLAFPIVSEEMRKKTPNVKSSVISRSLLVAS